MYYCNLTRLFVIGFVTRQQLNLNGLHTSLKYDSKSQELKNEMLTIQYEKENLEKSLNEENKKNETFMSMLEQTESNLRILRDLNEGDASWFYI